MRGFFHVFYGESLHEISHSHNGVDSSGAMGGPRGHGGPRQLAGMTTPVHGGEVRLADIPIYLTALGTVIPNATVIVTSQVSGTLTHVYFKEGEKVAAGQLLGFLM